MGRQWWKFGLVHLSKELRPTLRNNENVRICMTCGEIWEFFSKIKKAIVIIINFPFIQILIFSLSPLHLITTPFQRSKELALPVFPSAKFKARRADIQPRPQPLRPQCMERMKKNLLQIAQSLNKSKPNLPFLTVTDSFVKLKCVNPS